METISSDNFNEFKYDDMCGPDESSAEGRNFKCQKKGLTTSYNKFPDSKHIQVACIEIYMKELTENEIDYDIEITNYSKSRNDDENIYLNVKI